MKKIIKLAALGIGAAAVIDSFNNNLEVSRYEVSSEKIPSSFDGCKIAHISDYHCDTVSGVSCAVLKEKPDIIVSTGDLTDDMGSFTPALRLCQRLATVAPIYAVTGNHDLWREDYADFEKAVKAVGVTTLRNERIFLRRGEGVISLFGVDDPFNLSLKKAREVLNKNISALPSREGYNILLFHRANLFDSIKDKGFDLVLTGHMHGGQIRLPSLVTKGTNGVGLASPSSGWAGSRMLFPKYTAGIYGNEQCRMIVSRGIGNPMIIPRVYNRPEIAIITLRHI